MALALRFEDGGREFELRPADGAAARPLPDGFERIDCAEARLGPWPVVPRWLRRCAARPLRDLAEDADLGAGPLREPQLHDAVLRLIGQGRLRLFELVRHGRPDAQQVEVTRLPAAAVTPSMLRAAAAPAPAAPVVVPAAVAPAVDPDRQAAVLRQAAALGTPFCEECRRLQAAEAMEAA